MQAKLLTNSFHEEENWTYLPIQGKCIANVVYVSDSHVLLVKNHDVDFSGGEKHRLHFDFDARNFGGLIITELLDTHGIHSNFDFIENLF